MTSANREEYGLPLRVEVKSAADRPNPQLVARRVRICWLLVNRASVRSDPHTDITAGATLSGSASRQAASQMHSMYLPHKEHVSWLLIERAALRQQSC